RWRARIAWRSIRRPGHPGADHGVVKLRCSPTSTPCSRAMGEARSESAMNTIALAAKTAPHATRSAMAVVVSRLRPQSAALTISRPRVPVTTRSRSGRRSAPIRPLGKPIHRGFSVGGCALAPELVEDRVDDLGRPEDLAVRNRRRTTLDDRLVERLDEELEPG